MLIKIAFKNLFRNPRRSFAILITVALGVSSLFLYHGFNFGIMNQYRVNTIRTHYGHGQINTVGYRDQVYEKPWEHWIDNYQEIYKKLKGNPKIKHVFPRLQFYGLLTNGKINVSGKGQGVDAFEESKFFTALNIIDGKMLTDEIDGVMLGKGLARSLNVGLGDRVTVLVNTVYGSLNGVDLNVVGIFHTGIKDFDDAVFRLPIKQAQFILDTNKVESISLGLAKDSYWKEVKFDIEKIYNNLELTPFEILDKVFYQNAIDFLKKQFDFIKIIIIIIVVLGIFNTVSTSVLERKQEIGNLRANGESAKDVMSLLLFEAVLLGFIGGVLGILVSVIINNTLLINGVLMPPSPGLTRQFNVFVELQPYYGLVTLLIGLATTTVGVLVAGYKIVLTPIAQLLRSA